MASPKKQDLPIHIGIIMDGNGRWAEKQKKIRTFGHKEGLSVAKKIVKHASQLGIKNLTLYTFSTENWKRTEEEVGFLMQLIHKHLKKEMSFYKKNSIKVQMIGDPTPLTPALQKVIKEVTRDTAHFGGLCVNLAINYGGRDEIVRAVNRTLKSDTKEITESDINNNLDNKEAPDVDLIIRTAGEQRLSNFLIWQAAYCEYFFCDTLWPDFDEKEFDKAIESFYNRDRKFGGVK